MRLLLINPKPRLQQDLYRHNRYANVPPLGLAYLAACTPQHWDVRILDENIEKMSFENADLVGITSLTCNIPRAYEIASEFRRRRVKTVIGGLHASMLPDEAQRYADSVIVGEAESIWPQVLRDHERGKLRRRYAGQLTDLQTLPIPRRELLSKKYALNSTIQTSRGCPMRCNFCSVSRFNGGTYRTRPIESVVDEIESLNSKIINFVDDNIVGCSKSSSKRAIGLFKEIVNRGLNIRWIGQASVNMAMDPELMRWAQKSGCSALFIGIESADKESLKQMDKDVNIVIGPDKYKEIIDTFHDHGVGLIGGPIMEKKNDRKDVFDRTVDFIRDSEIDVGQVSPLTPLPGTRLYERLNRENRLIRTDYPQDWAYYDIARVVFKPRHMTSEELAEGIWHVYQETAGLYRSLGKSIRALLKTRNLLSAGGTFVANRGYYNIFKEMQQQQTNF